MRPSLIWSIMQINENNTLRDKMKARTYCGRNGIYEKKVY